MTASAFQIPPQVYSCSSPIRLFFEMSCPPPVLDASMVLHDERVGSPMILRVLARQEVLTEQAALEVPSARAPFVAQWACSRSMFAHIGHLRWLNHSNPFRNSRNRNDVVTSFIQSYRTVSTSRLSSWAKNWTRPFPF